MAKASLRHSPLTPAQLFPPRYRHMPQPGCGLPQHLGSAWLFKASGTKVRPPPLGDGPVRPRKVPGTAGAGRAARGRRPEAGRGAVVLRGLPRRAARPRGHGNAGPPRPPSPGHPRALLRCPCPVLGRAGRGGRRPGPGPVPSPTGTAEASLTPPPPCPPAQLPLRCAGPAGATGLPGLRAPRPPRHSRPSLGAAMLAPSAPLPARRRPPRLRSDATSGLEAPPTSGPRSPLHLHSYWESRGARRPLG